jgi:hypothetical protein
MLRSVGRVPGTRRPSRTPGLRSSALSKSPSRRPLSRAPQDKLGGSGTPGADTLDLQNAGCPASPCGTFRRTAPRVTLRCRSRGAHLREMRALRRAHPRGRAGGPGRWRFARKHLAAISGRPASGRQVLQAAPPEPKLARRGGCRPRRPTPALQVRNRGPSLRDAASLPPTRPGAPAAPRRKRVERVYRNIVRKSSGGAA